MDNEIINLEITGNQDKSSSRGNMEKKNRCLRKFSVIFFFT